ncbi:ATP-binding protein [Ureibacillus sp. GCM10028918]
MIAITITVFCIGLFSIDPSNKNVKKGVVDLTDGTVEKTIKLNGQWEFYADELLTPTQIAKTSSSPTLIHVPGSWESQVNSKNEVEVGTYRVVVKVPIDGNYGIRIKSIRHANKVFMNGIEVGGMGNPTTQLSEYSFFEKKFNTFGKSSNGEIEIVIQVAHRYKSNGGIVRPIVFGSAEDISIYTGRTILFDGVIIAGSFLIGLIFLLINIIRKRAAADLYFALYCFAQGISTATQNEKLILIYAPEMGNRLLWQWQYLSLHLAVIFLTLFFFQVYKDSVKKHVMWIITGMVCLAAVIYSIENPIVKWIYKDFPPVVVQIIPIITMGSALLLTVFIIVKAIIRKKNDTIILLVSVTAFICYAASLGLELLFEVDMRHWPIIAQLVLMISIAFFISYRNEKANKQVNRLTQELLLQNEIKDELIVKISQEMNKPLSELLDSSKVLMDGKVGPLKAKQQEAVISMSAGVNKLRRIIDDFLHASKVKGQMQFAMTPISLHMLNELIYEVSFFVKETDKVKIKNNIPLDLPIIMTDEKRLKQALTNILHNAVKYTEAGEISVNAYENGKFVDITIKDTGIGIEKHRLQKVFDTFYQIPNVPQNQKDGLGVGLSIAQQYIKLMNGNISIESQIGKGTTVTISLPIYEGYFVAKDAMGQTAAATDLVQESVVKADMEFPLLVEGKKEETILIIDHDKNDLLKMTDLLVGNGYNVCAYNGREGVQDLISTKRVDLIIIDVHMPKNFILVLTEEIRKLFQITELPIILLSRTDRLDDVGMLFKKGINAIIRKPIMKEEFISQIQSLLAMKEAVEWSVKQELMYYYAQITPHFLYNTLNSIIGLSYEDAAKSREALEYLSVYFRAKLDFQKQLSIVSIEEEMELVEAYLAIEQLRFKELRVELDIDESVAIKIPSMTLQPLVENAIHHGLVNKNDAKIIISIQRVGEYVQIVVEDNGVGMSNEQQQQLLKGQNQRLGFQNPFKKIMLMHNSKFELYSTPGEGTRIVMIVRDKQ